MALTFHRLKLLQSLLETDLHNPPPPEQTGHWSHQNFSESTFEPIASQKNYAQFFNAATFGKIESFCSMHLINS